MILPFVPFVNPQAVEIFSIRLLLPMTVPPAVTQLPPPSLFARILLYRVKVGELLGPVPDWYISATPPVTALLLENVLFVMVRSPKSLITAPTVLLLLLS